MLKLQGEFLPAPGFDLASAAPYERVFMQPVARAVGVRLPPGPVAPGATVAYGGYTLEKKGSTGRSSMPPVTR